MEHEAWIWAGWPLELVGSADAGMVRAPVMLPLESAFPREVCDVTLPAGTVVVVDGAVVEVEGAVVDVDIGVVEGVVVELVVEDDVVVDPGAVVVEVGTVVVVVDDELPG